MNRRTPILLQRWNSAKKCQIFPLPLTVREAVEVWLPTVKMTVPESALVMPRKVRLCNWPWVSIRFISLFCNGTSWSFHWVSGASSWESRHSKRTSSPSYTTRLSKYFRMLTSASVWEISVAKLHNCWFEWVRSFFNIKKNGTCIIVDKSLDYIWRFIVSCTEQPVKKDWTRCVNVLERKSEQGGKWYGENREQA